MTKLSATEARLLFRCGQGLIDVRQGKHTIDRFNGSGFAAFTTIDGMTTVPASSRIGLGAKWKNSEGAR